MATQVDIEKRYTCSICLEIYCKPTKLPCGHIFCSECIIGHESSGETKCPLCRLQYSKQKKSLDQSLERLMKATQTFCQGCKQQLVIKDLRSHMPVCSNNTIQIQKFAPVAATSQHFSSDLPNRSTFACPYCSQRNLDVKGLVDHCNSKHRNSPVNVVCPVCASMPWGDPNMKSGNFLAHLNNRHKFEYDTFVDYENDDDEMLKAALQASLEQQ